jgi:hypothetical protein
VRYSAALQQWFSDFGGRTIGCPVRLCAFCQLLFGDSPVLSRAVYDSGTPFMWLNNWAVRRFFVAKRIIATLRVFTPPLPTGCHFPAPFWASASPGLGLRNGKQDDETRIIATSNR